MFQISTTKKHLLRAGLLGIILRSRNSYYIVVNQTKGILKLIGSDPPTAVRRFDAADMAVPGLYISWAEIIDG